VGREMRVEIEFTDPNDPTKSLSLVKEPESATSPVNGLWLYTQGGEGMGVSEEVIFKILSDYYVANF